jgi:hypothetical protein
MKYYIINILNGTEDRVAMLLTYIINSFIYLIVNALEKLRPIGENNLCIYIY